ncbi:MAG: alpha/beta fold hydrolase [Firmicutes bacterium]|nr:alpha/beta fold hydrolase [Bacillota bacterium]
MFITVNGVRLEYNDGGDGIPIVTLHGGPGMSNRASDWRTFQPFTDQYRLISYDQRGNGGSEGKEPYTHEQWVADLEAMRHQLGLGKIVLTGGSYGGHLALEYAIRHQDNLRALILRDTAASNKYQDTAMKRARESGLPMDLAALERLFGGRVSGNEEFRSSFAMIQPLYNVVYDPEEGKKALAAIPFRYETHNWAFGRNQPGFDIVHRLKEIRVPTLVIVGRHDWITPLEASEEIAREIPGSRLVIFEHSGHSPQKEENARFLQLVRDFLQEMAPAA